MSEQQMADAFSELVRSRRSVRDFLPDEIPPAVLSRVLDDAKWSPSWTNTQPYALAIATGEKLERIRREYCRLYDEGMALKRAGLAGKVRTLLTGRGRPDGDYNTLVPYPDELLPARRATGYGLYQLLGIAREDRAARDAQMRKNFEFFGAPAAIFVLVHGELFPWAIQDGGILMQTIMLSARANGLGTCAQGAIATWASPVRREFEYPENYKLACGIAIGYPSNDAINGYNPGRQDLKVWR